MKHIMVEPETLGPADCDVMYRGCPLTEVQLYCHGPVGTTERLSVLCPYLECLLKFYCMSHFLVM